MVFESACRLLLPMWACLPSASRTSLLDSRTTRAEISRPATFRLAACNVERTVQAIATSALHCQVCSCKRSSAFLQTRLHARLPGDRTCTIPVTNCPMCQAKKLTHNLPSTYTLQMHSAIMGIALLSPLVCMLDLGPMDRLAATGGHASDMRYGRDAPNLCLLVW